MVLTTELLDVHLGRPVQLVNVHGELNGPLYAFGSETLQFEANGPVFRRAEWAVFTEKPSVVLPDVHGAYLDNRGNVWAVDRDGVLKYNGDPLDQETRESFAPFKRLRDEAGVAAEVLGDIKTVYGENYLDNSNTSWNEVAEKWAAR